MMRRTVAVLGMGAMGSRIALRLLNQGHALRVYNRSEGPAVAALREAGAAVVETPRAAAHGAELVIAMVTDDDAARAVWLDRELGALRGLSAGAVAVDCSTLSVAQARALANDAQALGVRFLEAPVVGSRPQAEAGQLVALVGGERATCEEVAPVLGAFAAAIHHVGSHGHGAALKLAINGLFATQVAALAELLGSLSRAGVDVARAVAVLTGTAVSSPAAAAAAASMLSSSFAPLFPVALVCKDLGYAVDAAHESGGDAPVARAVRDVFAHATVRGFGGEHLTAVARLYRTL